MDTGRFQVWESGKIAFTFLNDPSSCCAQASEGQKWSQEPSVEATQETLGQGCTWRRTQDNEARSRLPSSVSTESSEEPSPDLPSENHRIERWKVIFNLLRDADDQPSLGATSLVGL